VFKKYIYKAGVRHGPYLYESKRVGNKVVTRYVGVGKTSLAISRQVWTIGLSLLAVVFVALFFFYGKGISGNVVLQTAPTYTLNEPLSGQATIILEDGDSIQKDTQATLTLLKNNSVVVEITKTLEELLGNFILKYEDKSLEMRW